ncbi:hypothetical protein NC652_037634 [Populus alba x Populus x berolinensis]|nr:hypothetical protein NC652_037634 [Populus alba x Populus x berolinensis]
MFCPSIPYFGSSSAPSSPLSSTASSLLSSTPTIMSLWGEHGIWLFGFSCRVKSESAFEDELLVVRSIKVGLGYKAQKDRHGNSPTWCFESKSARLFESPKTGIVTEKPPLALIIRFAS